MKWPLMECYPRRWHGSLNFIGKGLRLGEIRRPVPSPTARILMESGFTFTSV